MLVAVVQSMLCLPVLELELKETMVPSAVHHVVVIWMIVKFLDLMEIQAGVVAAVVAEEEALIHVVAVVVDTMIVVVAAEDTTIHAMETPVGEGVEVVVVVVPHLDLIAVELMESLPGEEVVVAAVVEWADWDQMVPLHPEEASALA
jgi:hypothetical protein